MYGLLFLTMFIQGCVEQTEATDKLVAKNASVGIQVRNAQRKLKVNQDIVLPISIYNNAVVNLPSLAKPDGSNKINATYHWLKANGEVAVWDGVRTALPEDVKSGKSLSVALAVKAPAEPGKYVLIIDLVQEGVLWFADSGSQTATLTYFVE